MTTAKRLGVWMDHASAHLSEFTTDPIQTRVITSKFTHEEKQHSFSLNENLMHNKEQQQQSEYYKLVAEQIRKYDEVILFGPTNAKVELANLLKEDHHYAKIKIDVQQTDKMTDHQQHAFVKDYFSKTLII